MTMPANAGKKDSNMTELQGQWQTYPAESTENGRTIIVTVRTDIEKFRENPRFIYRMTIAWPYQGGADGMPDEPTAELMEQATDLLAETFRKDPLAAPSEIPTGDDRREWVFQTQSLGIFNKKINQALQSLPLLPLEFEAEEDPEWELYTEGLPEI